MKKLILLSLIALTVSQANAQERKIDDSTMAVTKEVVYEYGVIKERISVLQAEKAATVAYFDALIAEQMELLQKADALGLKVNAVDVIKEVEPVIEGK